MCPTALGLKAIAFYLTVLTSFYVSPYSSLFFLLLAFLSVVLLLNLRWTWSNLDGVSARVLDVEPCAAGSSLQVTTELTATATDAFGLGMRLDIDGERHRLPRCSITPRAGMQRITGDIPMATRGIHVVDAMVLDSTYPLGLVRRRIPATGPREVVVYPAPVQLTGDGDTETIVEASERLLRESGVPAGDERSPGGLREYRPGDEMRNVHWRASARSKGLVVKTWDTHGERGIEIVLDRRTDDPQRFEDALSSLSTLALRCRETKEGIVLKSQGIDRTFGGDGHDPIVDLLRWLATADPLPLDAQPPPAGSAGALRLPAERTLVEVAP